MRKPILHRTSNCHSSKGRYHSSMFGSDPLSSSYNYESKDCKKHKEHPDCECIPGQGELVKNGGFENPHRSFTNWVINSGVDVIDPGMGNFPHQGHTAARLGFIEPQALLYQIVPGICPGGFYQLVFFMGTAKNLSNAAVIVRLEFLDRHKQQLGGPALDILIPQNSLFESYTAFINNTAWPSPPRTRFIRLVFETDTGADADNYVTLDDVSLAALEGTSHI